jgi:hypothetical protein
MPNVTGTTRAQTTFLRAFKTSSAGPPPALKLSADSKNDNGEPRELSIQFPASLNPVH